MTRSTRASAVRLLRRLAAWTLIRVAAFPLPGRDAALGRAIRLIWRDQGLSFGAERVDVRHLGELARHDAVSQALMTRRSTAGLTLDQTAQAVVDRLMLRPAVIAIASTGDAEARSSWCRRVVEAEGDHVELALGVVGAVADSIATGDASSILEFCFRQAAQPIGPYGSAPLASEAAKAATELLKTHFALDVSLVDQFGGGPGDGVRAIGAAVIQGRRDGAEELLLAVLERWKPSRDRARQFVAECDSRRSLGDAVQGAQRLDTPWRERIPRYLGLAWYLTLLAIPLSAAAATKFPQLAVVRRFSYVEAIAIVALLLAVHVVAAQLAADRLPSPLAAGASQSQAIKIGYACAVAVVILTALVPSNGDTNRQVSAALTVAGSLFILAVIVAAYVLVRATDSVVAAQTFARARRGRYRKSGHRLGELQKRSIEFRVACETLPFVRFEPFPSRTERRGEVRAQTSGYLDADVKGVRKLAARQPWGDGRLSLRVTGVVATRVDRGSAIAAVVPDLDSAVDLADLKRVHHIFPIRKLPVVDEVNEAVAGLMELSRLEAVSGDRSGASRVAETICDMILDHLDAVRRHRGTPQPLGGVEPPVAPSLLTLVSLVMAIDPDAPHAAIMHSIVHRLLLEADPLEKIAMGVAAHASDVASISRRVPFLLDCAARCLEIQDSDGEVAIRRVLKSATIINGQPNWPVLRGACELACLAPWLNYFRAGSLWEWYWALLPSTIPVERTIGALSVGASCLRAGHLSLAVAVSDVLRLEGLDVSNAIGSIADEADARSQLNGRYLGDNSRVALERFVRFTQRYQGSVGAV